MKNINIDLVNFKLEEIDNIAILTNNRPDVLNALSNESWIDLKKAVNYIGSRDDIKALIITGEGQKSFASGADINNLKTRNGMDHFLNAESRNTLNKLESLNIPTIAAVNGYALGGGFELALSCDLRIASTNAVFGLPEPDLGLVPGLGGTQRLVRIAGVGLAKNVIIGGKRLDYKEATDSNICISYSEPNSLLQDSINFAKKIIRKGPLSINISKKLISAAYDVNLEHGLMMEVLSFALLLDSNDNTEGIDAFLEKRQPQFKGN